MVNEWTRSDFARIDLHPMSTPTNVLDEVAAWLNTHHPKPASDLLSSAAECVLDAEERASSVKADAVRWRRAHGIVEGERDQARRERDGAVQARNTALVLVSQAQDERDEALARAEAAEARTTPAVTHADIEKVIDQTLEKLVHGDWIPTAAADAVWSLVSGDDPAVFVVRESDLPEVCRTDDGWADGTRHGWEGTPETAIECVETHLEWACFYAAVARAIEAGQAVDPLLDKAQEFAALADWELTDREAGLLHTVARHVLGQEASDGR